MKWLLIITLYKPRGWISFRAAFSLEVLFVSARDSWSFSENVPGQKLSKKKHLCASFFGVKMNPFEQKQRVIPDTRFSHTVHPDSQETPRWVFLLLLFYSQLIIWIIKTANRRKYPLQLFAVPGKRKRQIKRTTLNFWLGFHFYSDPLLIMRDLKITNIQEGRRVSTFVIRTYLFQNNRCLK